MLRQACPERSRRAQHEPNVVLGVAQQTAKQLLTSLCASGRRRSRSRRTASDRTDRASRPDCYFSKPAYARWRTNAIRPLTMNDGRKP